MNPEQPKFAAPKEDPAKNQNSEKPTSKKDTDTYYEEIKLLLEQGEKRIDEILSGKTRGIKRGDPESGEYMKLLGNTRYWKEQLEKRPEQLK